MARNIPYYTKTDFKNMRTYACRALGRCRSGVNPHLALTAPDDARDPQFMLAFRKCCFWRKFFQKFPQYRVSFLERAARTTFRVGPAAVFRRTLADLGWNCHEHGVIVHKRGWQVDWMNSSRRFLQKMIEMSWNLQACSVASSRKNFDIECIDLPLIRGTMKNLDTQARSTMTNYIVGKHVTNDALVHYSRGAETDACPLCSEKDGRRHRVFECPMLETERNAYPGVMQWLRDQHTATALFGLPALDLSSLDSRCSMVPRRICAEIGVMPTDQTFDVFTDGSAYYTHDFTRTVAAGAFICCTAKDPVKYAALVPGCDHSPYRAEVWAILLAVQTVFRAVVFTDCAAALRVAQYLTWCRKTGVCPNFKDHHDLWGCIWKVLLTRPPECILFEKVKAHMTPEVLGDPTLVFRARMNNMVDADAKDCIRSSTRGFVRQFNADEKATKKKTKMFQDLHAMWNAMNAKCFSSAKTGPLPSVRMPEFSIPFTLSNAVTCQCSLDDDVLKACPFGFTFAKRVCDYFDGLRWDLDQQPVSCLEVYVDFCLSTSSVAPVCTNGVSATFRRKQIFELPDMSVAADAFNVPLVSQSRIFVSMIKWLLRNWDAPFVPRTKVKSLSMCGYLMPAFSLSGVPEFRMQTQARQQLWNYFHVQGKAKQDLSRNWRPPSRHQVHAVAHAGG